MGEDNRVLAYKKSYEIADEDLSNVSGGSTKLTVQSTQRMTGQYPGVTDVETDQIWN